VLAQRFQEGVFRCAEDIDFRFPPGGEIKEIKCKVALRGVFDWQARVTTGHRFSKQSFSMESGGWMGYWPV